jgi:hypothetical protein
VPTSHPRVQVTVDPELAEAIENAEAHLHARGRAGVLRELALRGAKEVSHQANQQADARREAFAVLNAYDFSELSEIVAEREQRLPLGLP